MPALPTKVHNDTDSASLHNTHTQRMACQLKYTTILIAVQLHNTQRMACQLKYTTIAIHPSYTTHNACHPHHSTVQH